VSTLKNVRVPLPIARRPLEIFQAEPDGSWFNDLPILWTLIAALASSWVPASKPRMSTVQQMVIKLFIGTSLSRITG
jgi:hypothetical protein